MSLPYVSGNWTFSAENQPSAGTTKSITLPDVDWDTDYSLSPTAPTKEELNMDSAMYYSDTTGSGMQSVGRFAVGRKLVRNIYDGTDIPAAARLPQSTGMKVLEQYVKTYKAVNSVSAAELEFTLKGNFFVTAPMWSAVPAEVLTDFVVDFLAHITGTSSDIVKYLLGALRGDLDFTR